MNFKNKIKTGFIAASLFVPLALYHNAMAANYQPISTTDFESGAITTGGSTYYDWYVQANTGSIYTMQASKSNIVKITINKNDDFSKIANGSPRAELQNKKLLYTGKDYAIKWKMFIPADYQFDNPDNRELFMQVHHTSGDGSPPFEIGLSGGNYYYDSNYCPVTRFGSTSTDRGRWVDWTLRYKPSATGGAEAQIYKDGQLLATYNGQNAYPTGSGYVKMGIYKWDWRSSSWPSQVSNRTVYFDDIIIYQDIEQPADPVVTEPDPIVTEPDPVVTEPTEPDPVVTEPTEPTNTDPIQYTGPGKSYNKYKKK